MGSLGILSGWVLQAHTVHVLKQSSCQSQAHGSKTSSSTSRTAGQKGGMLVGHNLK